LLGSGQLLECTVLAQKEERDACRQLTITRELPLRHLALIAEHEKYGGGAALFSSSQTCSATIENLLKLPATGAADQTEVLRITNHTMVR
jgi:hypothetical protein